MSISASLLNSDKKLDFSFILNQLNREKILSDQQLAQIKKLYPNPDNNIHPLKLLAELNLRSNTRPEYPLTLEKLTQWLAAFSGFPYVRIDPLKINVNEVTRIVSQAYATKLNILPIEIRKNELVIANCEPFITGWEQELSRIAKMKIKRVIANPGDIERYLVEFYGISRSIFGAVSKKSGESI